MAPTYVHALNEPEVLDTPEPVEKRESYDQDSRQRAFRPRGGSRDFLMCRDPEVVFYGPSGTGKSFTSLHKLYMVGQKYPGSRQAIVRRFRSTITQSAMVTFEQKVCLPGDGVKFNSTEQQYNFPNGSAIVVAGLDDPTKILSTEFDIIYVQECTEIDEATWEMLKTRIRWGRVPYQQVIGDCNPDSEQHWIKQREKTGKLTLIGSRHTDNPAYWDEEKQEWTDLGKGYIENLQQMSGHMYERFYLGNWVGAEGMIFSEYNYKKHLIPAFKIPKHWTRYLAIDFGYTRPFVCQWWAEDPDGRLYRYRELYGTQQTVEDWAHQIHTLSGNEDFKAIICDHDAEDRATLERHLGHPAEKCIGALKKDFHTVPKNRVGTIAADKANNSVSIGIQEVQNRFKPAGDGRPRLFLFKDALAMEPDPKLLALKKPTCTEQEIESYVWDQITSGRLGTRIMEQPRKVDDHGVDAMRYMVHYLDGKNAQMSSSVFGQKTRHTFSSKQPAQAPSEKLDFFRKFNA